jgi:hypothetical protein
MPRFALLLLILGLLLARPTPSEDVLRFTIDLLSSSDSGRKLDPESPTPSELDPDRGWDIDPDG